MLSKKRIALLTLAVLLPLTAKSWGIFGGCQHCGCQCECRKVSCKVICEMKEVTKVTWGCKCVNFCVPGKSTKIEPPCGGCGHCDTCKAALWIPGCAEVRTKVVPVKHEKKVKVPVYKWIVVDLCPKCAANPACTNPPAPAE